MPLRSLFNRHWPPASQTIEIVFDQAVYQVRLRRHRQARRYTLRIHAASREAVLTLPPRASIREAKAFAERHGGWIAARLARIPPAQPFCDGAVIPLRGVPHRIVHRPGTRGTVWVEDAAGGEPNLCVAGDAAHIRRRIEDFLKREARRDLEAIAAVLAKHPQVWVYADEIYSKLVYDGEFVSIASLPGMQERTIISDGASKTYAMTGWRIGFTANRTLAPVFTRWITNTESCASQISQWAALAALTGPQDEAEKMRARFRARRDLIVRLLNDVPGFRCASPGGAFYAWPNVTEACARIGAKDSEELRKRLLHEAGVAVLADIHFGPRTEGEGQHIRFSYATSEAAIEAGVARIADFIRRATR
mgnify:CR=1 FL=1